MPYKITSLLLPSLLPFSLSLYFIYIYTMEPLLESPSIKSWLKKVVSTHKKNTKSPGTKRNNKKMSMVNNIFIDVFNVPLYESLQIANTHIAYEDRNTIIGSIPIVVAKCGSFLKDQGESIIINIKDIKSSLG